MICSRWYKSELELRQCKESPFLSPSPVLFSLGQLNTMVRISFTPILFLFATLSSLSLAFPIEPRHFTTLENDLLQLSKAAAVFSSQINSIHTILDPDILVGSKPICRIKRRLHSAHAFSGSLSPSAPACLRRH